MLTDEERQALRPRMLTLGIVHAALLMTLLVYAALAFIVSQDKEGDQEPAEVLFIVLGGLAAASGVGAFLLYGWYTGPAKMAGCPPAEAFGRWQTAVIVRDAVLETAAIYGLLLVFLGADPVVYLWFGGPVVLVFVAVWPTLSSFEAKVEEGRDFKRQEV